MTHPTLARAAVLLIALSALAVTACTDDKRSGDPHVDSQTHWLISCQDNATCGDGLSCLCGVCTLACDRDSACAPTDGATACVTTAAGAASLLCEDAAPPPQPGLCLPSCDADADCPADLHCRRGSCIPPDRDNGCDDVPGPSPDLCTAPDTTAPITDPAGCVTAWACHTCPQIAAPGPDFCGDEQRIEPVYDDFACVVSYACVDATCDPPSTPDCADGQAIRTLENSAGCITWICVDGGDFACGASTCDLAAQTCDVFLPGQPDGEATYSCTPLPEACLPAPTCTCLEGAAGGGSSCAEGADRSFTVTLAAP